MTVPERLPASALAALLALAALSAGAAPAAAAAAAQIEETDLPPAGIPDEELADAEPGSVQELFDRAVAVFLSPEQRDSIELFAAVIERLESAAGGAPLAPEERVLLARSYFYRGEVRFNFGERGKAEEDFRAAIRTDPSFPVDRARTSPRLVEAFEKLRAEVAGLVTLEVQPTDAVVEIGGRAYSAASAEPVPLLAGVWLATVERPGFASVEVELEVAAGERLPLAVQLERTSAVLRLSAPQGSEIRLDGALLPPAEVEPDPAGELAIVIDGLAVGTHTLEVAKEDFRKVSREIRVDELIDYTLSEPVVLVPSRGTLVLTGLPQQAMLVVDDEPRSPARGTGGTVSLELPAREHRVVVEQEGVGRFERTIELEDQETERIEVRLRPVVALVGVLGGDRDAAGRLLDQLRAALAGLEDWWTVDGSADGPALAAAHRLAAADLRGDGSPAAQRLGEEPRAALAGRFKAQICVLAVLSDDLFAAAADLWIWSGAAPALAPTVRAVEIGEPGSLAPLVEGFRRPLGLERAWLGARLLDSGLADGPVVAGVAPGSPAAAAGLAVGDEIVGVDGREPGSAGALGRALDVAAPGDVLRLALRRGGSGRTVEIALGTSFSVLAPDDPAVLAPAALARLALEGARERPAAPGWVLQLNRAAALARAGAWREAVTVLRETRAPAGAPLGQAAVDYRLGAALLGADASAYGEHAREAFARAAAVPGARLLHNDGPLVAPRARARAAELGGAE